MKITIDFPDTFPIKIEANRTVDKTKYPHPIFGKGGSTKAGTMQVTALNLDKLDNTTFVRAFTKIFQQELGITTDSYWTWSELDGSPKTIDAIKVFTTGERKTAMTKVINVVMTNKVATPEEKERLKEMSIPPIDAILDGDTCEYAIKLARALFYAGLVNEALTMTRIKAIGDQYAKIALKFSNVKL